MTRWRHNSDRSLRAAHRDWRAEPIEEYYDRYTRERRRMGLDGVVAPSVAGAEALLAAWPRYTKGRRRGQFKPADKITYDLAKYLVRLYFTAAGWLPKLMLLYDTDEFPPTHFVPDDRAPVRRALPIGFPLERDSDWDPIQFSALIAPDFSTILVQKGTRSFGFHEWRLSSSRIQPGYYGWFTAMNFWVTPRGPLDSSINAKDLAGRLFEASLRTQDPYRPNPPCPYDRVEFSDYRGSQGKKRTAVFRGPGSKQRTVHFGAQGYDDYTMHHDPERRARYLVRHRARENWDRCDSAGALSRWILWGRSTDRASNERAFRRRFGLNPPPLPFQIGQIVRVHELPGRKTYPGRMVVWQIYDLKGRHLYQILPLQPEPQPSDFFLIPHPDKLQPPPFLASDLYLDPDQRLDWPENKLGDYLKTVFWLERMHAPFAEHPMVKDAHSRGESFAGLPPPPPPLRILDNPSPDERLRFLERRVRDGDHDAIHPYVAALQRMGINDVAPERYVSPRQRPLTPHEARVREIAIGIKNNDVEAIEAAARAMAPYVPPGTDYLVPAPGHLPINWFQPRAPLGVTNLARRIAQLLGIGMIAAVERVAEVPSSRILRQAGRPGLSAEEHAESMELASAASWVLGQNLVLIDNVVVSGTTLQGMRLVLGHSHALGIAYAEAEDVVLPPRENPSHHAIRLARQIGINPSDSPDRVLGKAKRYLAHDPGLLRSFLEDLGFADYGFAVVSPEADPWHYSSFLYSSPEEYSAAMSEYNEEWDGDPHNVIHSWDDAVFGVPRHRMLRNPDERLRRLERAAAAGDQSAQAALEHALLQRAALTPDQRFFYDGSSRSWPAGASPIEMVQSWISNARDLAAAEKWADWHDFDFEWEPDEDPGIHGYLGLEPSDGMPWRVELREFRGPTLGGQVLSSLGGIVFGPGPEHVPWIDPYARIVQAELALDLMRDYGAYDELGLLIALRRLDLLWQLDRPRVFRAFRQSFAFAALTSGPGQLIGPAVVLASH